MMKTKTDETKNLHFKAFRFKIHPSDEQKQLINQTIGCCRFVYNYILNENIKSFEKTKKRYTETAAKKLLPGLKETFKWLSVSDSIALQASIEYQYEGFKKYKDQPKKELKKRAAKKCAEGYTPTAYDFKGHPTFKSKKNPVQSYTTKMTNNNIKITDNRIQLPKLGWIRFSKSRNIEGDIKRVTVRRSSTGRYSISVICEMPYSPYKPSTNDAVGIDLGLKEFAVLSNGESIANPKYYQKYEKRLAFLQRAFARKKEGSKSWGKNKAQIAKLHEKIKHTREDFLHKLTTRLVHENQVIAVENLSVKNLVQNKKLSKGIHDVSWSRFNEMLAYKAKWYGRTIIKVDPFFPSSQLCSRCGHQHKDVKNLAVRVWECPSCGVHHDRDLNASLNIKKEALRLLSLQSS
ncbi:IS200/IS605 family element RNA-guided endonuclease TnpB [Domibacillus indicus]|uniref:IS200/IS605 family element RNA-guided endonuclease TnpB n=1 Tax=Domibacillus indicus TaxID=1437523 RepID=UPI0020422EA7|nr:IS200/IS605 family element RNA-guided endonuclease TnpB [Domibacillus indicus]MCM3791066.1 IS200/IS605 family element RNA-guided endonuclease TnpB [Domibacillus indicus]